MTSPRHEIEKVIHIAMTASDPSVLCTKLATQRYVEQLTQTEGSLAVAECEWQAATSNGEFVAPSRIEVDGRRATVDLAVEGGPYDGQTLRVELIQLDGRWKFNEITEFVGLDRLRLLKIMGRIVVTEYIALDGVICGNRSVRQSARRRSA